MLEVDDEARAQALGALVKLVAGVRMRTLADLGLVERLPASFAPL